MELINQLSSVIESIRRNQVLSRIDKKRKDGSIRNEAEFQEELKNQLIDMSSAASETTYYPAYIPYGKAYSEYMNENFTSIRENLEVAFLEATHLMAKIKSHNDFFDKTIFELKNLEKKILQKVEEAEVVGGIGEAYNKAYVNSFIENKNMALDNRTGLNEILFDEKDLETFSKTENLVTNLELKKLQLPSYRNSGVKISAISVLPTETTSSFIKLDSCLNNTNSMINSDPTEMWTFAVASESQLESGAILALDIDLGDKRRVNEISVYLGAGTNAMFKSLSYQSETGEFIDLDSEERLLNGNLSVSFGSVIAKRFKLRLSQYTSSIISYDMNAKVSDINEMIYTKTRPDISSMSNIINQEIKDPKIQQIIGTKTFKVDSFKTLYVYKIDIKKITVSESSYKTEGVYVERYSEESAPILIGFQSTENRKNYTHKLTKKQLSCGNIEYTLFKHDYDGHGKKLRSSKFPILPLGTVKTEETIVFPQGSKIVKTRFLAHKRNGDGSSVLLKRNGELLIRGVDWRFVDLINPADDAGYIIKDSASSTVIELLHSNISINSGIYTVEYSPRYSTETVNKTLDNGVFYLPNGAVNFIDNVGGTKIEKCDIFVRIIIRNNDDENPESAEVLKYKLLIKE
jgi:hypothetical protein